MSLHCLILSQPALKADKTPVSMISLISLSREQMGRSADLDQINCREIWNWRKWMRNQSTSVNSLQTGLNPTSKKTAQPPIAESPNLNPKSKPYSNNSITSRSKSKPWANGNSVTSIYPRMINLKIRSMSIRQGWVNIRRRMLKKWPMLHTRQFKLCRICWSKRKNC